MMSRTWRRYRLLSRVLLRRWGAQWRQWRMRGYTLRNALPVGLLMVVIGMLSLSYLDSVVNGRMSLLQRARGDAVLDAERLARIAQRELKDRRNIVASDLAVAATEPRIAVLALINPQGRIELAQRLGWRGLRATEVLALFSSQAFDRTVKSRLPDVQEISSLGRIVVMVPFFVEGRAGVIRDEDRGVVYLEYDLTQELAMLHWDAQRRMWPLLLTTLMFTLLLARLLRSRVTQPLARVEQASLLLARNNAYSLALPETGPREVARLAHSFNVMAVRIKEAQHDIETSRMRLAGIFDAAMDAIITVDAGHKIRVINRAALRMFECREQEVLGEPIDILIPSRLRRSNSDFMELDSPRGLTEFMPGRHAVVHGQRLSGDVFPAEASVSRIDLDGEQWVTVMLRDVTERLKAEDAIIALNNSLEQQVEQRTARLKEATQILEEQQRILQAAHAEQRTIFETLTVGIALLKEGLIVRSNRRLEEIFGYGADQLMNRSTRVWYPDDASHAATQAAVLQVAGKGLVYQGDRELVRADGARFWARMTGRQLVDANLGSAVLVVIEDMTLQRVAEQAIHNASERALEASRAKSNFLANMSHEIRTPMNAIIGLSYLVLKSGLMPQQREQVRKIQSSSQLLLGIINDILDYSKIEAGKLHIERIVFPLAKVLDNVASMVADKASAKDLTLQFVVDPQVPVQLLGDPLRLSQILLNYTDNAIKFTQKGNVGIHISLREESATEVLLCGAVRDSGRGLTEAQMARLFQSFQQADSSITREYGGTGLGLAICKQLAGLMQGEVGVQSEVGVGSTFWFTARLGKILPVAVLAEPLVPVPPVNSGTHERAGVADDEWLRPIRGARVLLVEDNALNREVAGELLRAAGLFVDAARDGQQGLERMLSQHYDLVLMDMQMPVMDGLRATRLLRQQPGYADLPIIAMTANVTAADRQRCLDAGMNDHVAKPMEPECLFEVLLKWIKPALRPAPAPVPTPAVPAWDDVALPQVAGLDVVTGLRRVRGNKPFYLSLLRKFVQGQASVPVDVRASLYIGNRDEAQRIAHSLKALAGSVGAAGIQHSAADLEAAIRDGQTLQMLEVSIGSLERQLTPFIACLRACLPWHEVLGTDAPVDMAVLRAVCRRLARLLAQDNLEAAEMFVENEDLFQRAFGEAYERMEAEVRNFNCQRALEHLKQAAQNLAIDLGPAGDQA